MKTTKINSDKNESNKLQDKTDWNKVYNQSQSIVDREAVIDTENPVLKNARFNRLNGGKKK